MIKKSIFYDDVTTAFDTDGNLYRRSAEIRSIPA